MELIYNNIVVYRDFALEYKLFELNGAFVFEIIKTQNGKTESDSVPMATTKQNALRIVQALTVSQVTPCSLREALET